MDPISLEEETKPWLESNGKADIQIAKQKAYKDGIHPIYKPTTEEKPPILPQIFAAVAAASFHIVVGFALAYSAILVPQIEGPESDIKVQSHEGPWLASVLVLMVPVGALLAGVTMELVGRLNTIKIAAIPCLLGWFLIATGSSFVSVLCGRLLTGISAGMGTSPAIVYITEIANPDLRGALISTCPTLASLGMLLVYLKGAYLSWRNVAWASAAYTALPIFIISVFIPESPVWLVAKARVEEAENSLRWLNGKQSTVTQERLAAMIKSQDMRSLVAGGFFDRLKGFFRPTGYKPLLILFGLFFFQQFAGVYTTLFYSVELFENVGSGMDPNIATVLMGLVRLVMSFPNTALLSRFGRRPLCMLSGCGMAVCMITSGCFTQYILQGGQGVSLVPVICIFLYVCCSMLGLLSIPWTMTAELFPTEIRGLAHGITISMAHILMFTSIQSYRGLRDALGGAHAIQWFFASMALSACAFVFVFLPETHGRSLKEIEAYFVNNTIYLRHKKATPSQQPLHSPVENGSPPTLALVPGELVMITSKA